MLHLHLSFKFLTDPGPPSRASGYSPPKANKAGLLCPGAQMQRFWSKGLWHGGSGCVYTYLSVSQPINQYIYQSIYVYLSTVSIHLFECQSARQPVVLCLPLPSAFLNPSVSLSLYLSLALCPYLPISTSMSLSIYTSIHEPWSNCLTGRCRRNYWGCVCGYCYLLGLMSLGLPWAHLWRGCKDLKHSVW